MVKGVGSRKTGAARSSSARGLNCSVKSGNERNPYRMLNFLIRDCPGNGEEGGDDVRSAWPLCLGQHTCYNGWYKGLQYREMELIPKTSPSSDWSLKLDSMKLDSLVNVDHHATLNTFSSLAHWRLAVRCASRFKSDLQNVDLQKRNRSPYP